MNVIPAKLAFHDVRLNQSDTKTLTITNTMSVETSFSLRPSSARYSIFPTGNFKLSPKESIVVSVRLMVDSYSNVHKGINGQEDSIMIKLPFDTQKIPVVFYLHNQYVSSRSPSPVGRVTTHTVKKSAAQSEASDIVNTLNEQIRHKDIRISELESILGNVKSKNPGFDEIVAGRIRAVQADFEEKAKKFMDIVKEKDAQVARLEEERTQFRLENQMYKELTQHDVSMQSRAEGHSHQYWSGRALPGQATGLGSTHQQLANMLEQTQKQLESEKTAHFQSRTQLNEAHSEIEELVRLRDQSMSGGGRWQLQERKELSGLREQNLDHAEEIKTLSRELEKLRKEASEHRGVSEDLQHALREARRLKDDLAHAQQKYKQLEETHEALQSAHEALEHLSQEQQQHLQQLQHQQHQAQQQANQRTTRGSSSTERSSTHPPARSDPANQNNGRVSWHEQSQQRAYQEHSESHQSHHQSQHQSHQGERSLRMDGQQFEESVGGGLATSTPVHYALHPSGTTQQAIHEKNAALSLYEDRMSRYEEEIQQLKDRIAEGQKSENALKDRLAEVENQLQGRDQEGRLLSERVERLKSEREANLHEAEDKDIQLRSALERVSQHSSASAVNDAHLWWAYIWHAMKQQQDVNGPLYHNAAGVTTSAMPKTSQPFLTEVGAGGTSSNVGAGATSVPGGSQPGSLEYKPPHDAAAAVHEARLRDNLRAQAIEIAQLRQELIGRKLTFKKEMGGIKEQNEHFQREIVRMQAQSRIHRADKDLKIEQLSATVRTLSVRGDMHAQAAAALQQVETEKLTNHQLRADLDSYRLMLEEEQRKVLAGRKESATLQAQIDSSLVLQSVVNVPGVSPATLIELMAGQITQLEADTAKSRQSAAEATQQLRALQRTVNLTAQRRVVAGETAAGNKNALGAVRGGSGGSTPRAPQVPGSQRSRSLSPVGGRRASTGGLSGSGGAASLRRSTSQLNMLSPSALNQDEDQSFDDGYPDNDRLNGSAFSPQGHDTWSASPFSVVVDGEATPKQVIDSLDRAVLAQRVASQEVTIGQLHDLVDQLQAAAAQTDKELLVQLDEKTETERIEFEKCQRKQELLQTLLDEHKSELKKLQSRNNELEKSLSDIHASRLVEGYTTRSARAGGNANANGGNNSVFYEEAPLMGNHSSDLGSFAGSEVNIEENQKELESTKILLRERTTQLRVVMETLDALQLAGVKSSNSGNSKFHAEDELLFNRRSGTARSNHEDSTNTSGENLYTSAGAHYATIGLQSGTNKSLSSMEHTWGMQALIKRVVELTTELSSQCAHASLAARKAEDLELLSRRQAKEINHFKIHARTLEDAASRATLQLNSMCSQIQEGDRNYIDAAAALRQENEKLVTALRESEASLSACEIKYNALAQQATIADQSDFMGWLEFVTLDNQKLVTDHMGGISQQQMRRDSLDASPASPGGAHDKVVFNHKTIGDSSVRDLVVTLVLQWKEFVGSVPQMKPLTTPAGGMAKLSKAEQRFLQRVTDLVMHSNDRATKAQLDAQNAAARTKQVEHANQVALERLKICASHLNRYRKRCHAFEQVLSVDRKHEGLKKGKLESMLRESLSDMRSKHDKALEALRSEKRDRMINDVKRAMETQQLRKLQAQIAELEARGTATLRARDEAVQSLEGKLKQSEESMFKWFKVELPRLVSGLPATEDTLSSLYNENVNPNYGLDPSPFSSTTGDANAPISNQLLSSMGMDRTYALAQALCASRASLTVHEMRISGLTEKLSVLKERNLSLESVLIRWKDEIQATHFAASVPSVQQLNTAAMNPVGLEHQQGQFQQYSAAASGEALGAAQGYAQVMSNANKVEHAIQQVYSYADSEAALNTKVHELTTRLIELEEQNIELKGKCEQASARAVEMKALVDVVMNDEQQLKTKATQQLTKIRLGLEKEHSEELRRLRQSYETEKNTLLGELESVARAVEEAKLTSVDTTAWQRLVNADNRHGDAGEDLQYATQPRPTPIRTYVPTPPHEEKHRHKDRKSPSKSRRKDRDDREGSAEEKTGGKTQKRAHRKSSKHRQESSSSSDYSDSSSSSSSSSSGENSDSDSMRTPEDRQGRPRSRKEQSKHRSKKDKNEPTEHRTGASHEAGPHGTAATAYAQTLRKHVQHRPTTTSGRDLMDVRATPSSAGGANQDSNASISLSYLNQQQDLAEVQIENLERMLELERRRHAETQFEMSELQQLLDIQQAAFREHLNRDPPGLPAHIAPAAGAAAHKPSRHGSVQAGPAAAGRHANAAANVDQDISLSTFNETISVTSASPPPSERPEHDHHKQPHLSRTHLNFGAAARESATHILHEVQREDPALWPSLGNLLDELLNVLQGLSDRAGSVDDRLNVRTALAMAARVKVVCSSSPADRNIPSRADASRAGGTKDPSFHADQLFEELNRYSSHPSTKSNYVEPQGRGVGSSVRSGSSETRDHSVHLQSLANRVKMMESDFADDNIPERHLYLMRDLRMRVVEIEKTLTEELQTQQSQWASERAVLVRKAEESASLAAQLQQGQSESMSTMRQRYEDALKSAEEALESNTQAAKNEVSRLEKLLAQQTNELREVRAALAAKPASAEKSTEKTSSRGTSAATSIASAPKAASSAQSAAQKPPSRASTPPVPFQPVSAPLPVTTAPEQHLLGVPVDNLNEFLRMQRLVNDTNDELDFILKQRQQAENNHAREVSELKGHFSRYRRAQAEVVRSLEDQLEDLQEQLAGLHATEAAAGAGETTLGRLFPTQQNLAQRAAVDESLAGGPSLATNLSGLPEAEDVIRKMEFKYKVKTAELEAVMRTLSRMATGEGDTLASHDQSTFDNNTSTYSLDPPDLRPPPHPQHQSHGHPHSHSQHHQYQSQVPGHGHVHVAYTHGPPPPSYPQQHQHATSVAPTRSSREGGFSVGIGMSQHEGVDFGVLGNEHFDAVARDMQTELFEARIVTADKEIEALHRNLQKERNLNAQLKAQLQRQGASSQRDDIGSGNSAGRDMQSGTSTTAGASLGAPKQSAEPVLPSGNSSMSSHVPPASVPEPPKARLPTRRGSTGTINPADLAKTTTSNAIPTFAPTGAAAPGTTSAAVTGTHTSASGLAASNDPIFDFTQEYTVPEVNSDNEKTRLLVRRMNEMRRTARVEISQLKEQIVILKSDENKDEQGRPKEGTIADLKQQVAGLREDNARKNKILASMKANKVSEDNVLEQWKMEANQREETVKRLQRSISSKDAKILDLKAKVEQLEQTIATAQREGVVPPSTTGTTAATTGAPGDRAPRGLHPPGLGSPSTDITNMPAQELRARLRSSEADRGRMRESLNAQKENVKRLEADQKRLQAENHKLQQLGEHIESYKGSIARKDAIIKKLHLEVENLKALVDSLRNSEMQAQIEADKRAKQMQREVDLAKRSQHELENESQLMRKRLIDTETTRRAASSTTTSEANYTGTGVASTFSNLADRLMSGQNPNPTRSVPPARPTAVQQRRAAGSGSTPARATHSTGTALEEQDDLQDVISALGVSPLHLGLGLKPRSSTVSEHYTHNTTGLGSTMDRDRDFYMSPGEASTSSHEEVLSTEKRIKELVSSALQSPVKLGRL